MTANVYDFLELGVLGGGDASVEKEPVASGTTSSITAGDICLKANGYWAKVGDGGCNAAGWYGVARSTSTETASAAGEVEVAYSTKGLKLRGKPHTAGNLAIGIIGDRVDLEVNAGVQTVNEDGAAAGILTIHDYDSSAGTIDVILTATL